MQSFLQYRRFGKHIEAQFERNRWKAEALGNADTSESTSPSSSNTEVRGAANTRDLEKAEHSNGASEPIDVEDPATLGEGQTKEASGGYDPIRATPSGNQGSIAGEEAEHMSRASTEKSMGAALGTTLTGIDVRNRSTREGGAGKVFVVEYEGENDSLNPHNWSRVTRFGATVDSAALMQATEDFGVSEVTESLATGLFLIGFGIGALFAGPVSETVGRNPVYIATLSLYMIFVMASGLAPNIGAQLAFRFIAGCFAATPLVCAGGSISDLWSPMERTYAFPVFANASFMGPIFGPIVGGFVGQSSRLNWRWTEWITLITSGLVLSLVVFFQPETYAPELLRWKAAKLRQLTGDDRYKGEVEVREDTFIKRLGRALYRPFLLTFSEPIIILIALYLAVIYIILFTFLNGYTFIFTETYGFTQGITGLSFMGIGIGLCLASLLVPVIYMWAKKDLAKIKEEGGTRLPPEFRLWFGMFGAPAIPISMFWMGWTVYPSVSFWSPLGASVLFGYGILCVFISSFQYIIDSYETYSASALASMTLIRYVAAGGMVEAAIPFYKNLDVHWTLTILGCLSALLVPVPYLFYHFGAKIRKRSKYTVA